MSDADRQPAAKVMPRGRGRPRVRDLTREGATALARETATDPIKARRVISDVNQNRMMIAKRLANLDLFPVDDVAAAEWRAKKAKSDLVPFQVMFEMRAMLAEASTIDDAYKRVQCKTTLLTKIQESYMALVAEASKASDEWRKILESQVALDQRRKEHSDKMELERDKLGTADLDVADPKPGFCETLAWYRQHNPEHGRRLQDEYDRLEAKLQNNARPGLVPDMRERVAA